VFVAVVVFCPCLCVLSFAMLSPGYSGVVVVVCCCCCAVCVACDIGSDSTQGFAVVATVLERNTGYCILKRLLYH
jgi:hypothetical protein